MPTRESDIGTDRNTLRYAAYDADDDLRVRREFHENYSRLKDDFHEWVRAQLPLTPTDCLLDVGTGPGDFPQLLRRMGHEGIIIGMDLSEGMIRTGYASSPNLAWLVGDAQELPFSDGIFDGVMARHMLYHVPDIDRAVREMARVTRHGGWAAAVTNARDNMAPIYDLWDKVEHPAVATPEPISARFPLEDAAARFAPHFAKVSLITREDAAVLPAIEPLIQYLYSARHLRMKSGHTLREWQEVQNKLVHHAEALWAREAQANVLTISKRVGLVVGYRE